MELAQMYFPAIAPRSAWRRMKDLLRESSTTAELAEQSRRVFMPAEVSLIFETFGAPSLPVRPSRTPKAGRHKYRLNSKFTQ